MAVFRKGSIALNLGFVAISGDFDEEDRQCAWQLYCEIVTRRGVSGRVVTHADANWTDADRTDADRTVERDSFEGEVIAESLDSLHAFFHRAREIMMQFPVGRIERTNQQHLAFFIMKMLEVVVRPFLELWQGRYRHFWSLTNAASNPFERQQTFPQWRELTRDWSAVRAFCRETARELVQVYGLVDLAATVPVEVQAVWQSSQDEP